MSRVVDPDGSRRQAAALALTQLTALEVQWQREQAPLRAGDRVLWIGMSPCPETPPPGVLQASFIVAVSGEFGGDAVGALDALPITDASASHVVLQHALESMDDASSDALIQECARVLKPSGILTLYGFHPRSLWRRQFDETDSLAARGPVHWRRSLHALGFEVQRAQRIGSAFTGAPSLLDRFGVAYGLRAWRAGAAIIPLRGRVRAASRPELAMATRTASAARQSAQSR